MPELSPASAAQWLASQDVSSECHAGTYSEMGGGVSNKVILAELPGRRAVLKQALGQLRVEHEWLSDRSRIFREAAALRWLQGKVHGGRVPRLLAEDRSTCTIAMEAAPETAEMWKTQLFRGEFDVATARAVGTLLGSVIAASSANPDAESLFGDQTVFHQLRIDPYYRFTASLHPESGSYFQALMARSAARRLSIVHGDWSPKNLLVSGGEVWAIDWEVVHYGDPSFDVAFLLNHFLLKSVVMPHHREALAGMAGAFMETLREPDWIEAAALEHLPALLLARVDGKSPAEYLDANMRNTARRLGLDLIAQPARSVTEVFSR